MENTICNPERIISLNAFNRYISEFGMFISSVATFPSPNHKDEFIKMMQQLVDIMRQYAEVNQNNDINDLYNNILKTFPEPFLAVYRQLDISFSQYKEYRKQEEEWIAEKNIEPMAEDPHYMLVEEKNYYEQKKTFIQPTFSVDESTVEPIKPIVINPFESENTEITFDLLNLLCSIMEKMEENKEQLNFMDVDRKAKKHQFDSEIELKRAFREAAKLIDKVVPIRAVIHCAVKKFGKKNIWESFLKLFIEIFVKGDKNHSYNLYEAIPKNGDYIRDKECDDELAAKLAVTVGMNKKKKGYLVSNDKYRSMNGHWSSYSDYNILVEGKNCIYDLPNISFNEFEKFKNTKCKEFIIRIDRCFSESEMCINLKSAITV